METNDFLPKDLPVALRFSKITLNFTHRYFEESLPGHFGLVSKFVLLELYAGSRVEDITGAFPFDVAPVIERLRGFSLLEGETLSGLGRHYAFCLKEIHGQDIQAWIHWGEVIKMVLPAEAPELEDDSPALDKMLKITPYYNKPYIKWRPDFELKLTGEKPRQLLAVLRPDLMAEYDEYDGRLDPDVWSVKVLTSAGQEQAEKGKAPLEETPGYKYCLATLPEGLGLARQARPAASPIDLPSLLLTSVYAPPASARWEEFCLLTGRPLAAGDSRPERGSPPAPEWPGADWEPALARESSALKEEFFALLTRKDFVSMHGSPRWRRRYLSHEEVRRALKSGLDTARAWIYKH